MAAARETLLFDTLVVSTRAPGVAQVTMVRAAVFNAFDDVMIGELDAAFAALEADAAVRVIVLAGDGKHFSAGADLQWMQRASTASLDWNLEDARRFAGMLARVERCSKPTVARVQGAALGGGVGLTAVCDLAILPAVIGPYVVNAIGKRQARRLALSTERIAASEALALGLVTRVVALDALDAAVDDAVQALLAGSPNAQREIKQLFAELQAGPVTADVVELTAQSIARVRGTAQAREGFDAFLAKRSPRWVPAR